MKKNSNLKELTDLKNKKVCFSRRDGIGWYSAVATLRQQKFIDSECRDHEGLSEFFSEICVMSKDDSNDKDSTDLPVCCSGTGDGVNIEANTFRCLQKDGCDVAFLDFNYFKRNAGRF